MGYRNYIGEMPKKEYNKIKSMTKEQLIDFYKINELSEKSVYEFGAELYEFGKYVNFNPPKKSMKKFFKNKEVMDEYNEHDFFIVTPEFLKYIIESYTKKVSDYYNDMITPFFGEMDKTPSDFIKSMTINYDYANNRYRFDFTKITDEQQTALYNILEYTKSLKTEWTTNPL